MGGLAWFISIVLAVVVAGLGFIYFSPDYSMYLVRSESMKPAINMGDMIVTGSVDGVLGAGFESGTIITYELGEHIVTHRVLAIDGDTLVTKGDAMEVPDPRPVSMSQVSGIYLFKVPYVGYLSSFMRTRLGWLLVVIIPGMVLVALLIKDIVKEALSID